MVLTDLFLKFHPVSEESCDSRGLLGIQQVLTLLSGHEVPGKKRSGVVFTLHQH